MRSYKFSSHLVIRSPAGSTGERSNSLQYFLDQEHFRGAVLMASKTLYDKVKDSGFRESGLNEKQRMSMLRYVNRFCYRSTPFGLFAAVSMIRWNDRTNLSAKKELELYLAPSEEYISARTARAADEVPLNSRTFRRNPTIYRLMDEYRFISTTINKDNGQREYLLQSTTFTLLLKNVLNLLASEKDFHEIVSFIRDREGCSADDASEYLAFLSDSQIIIDHLRQHITGHTDLHPIETGQSGLPSDTWQAPVHLRNVFGEAMLLRMYDHYAKHLQLASPYSKQSPLSAILWQNLDDGTLSKDHQKDISDGLFALDLLRLKEESPLNDFVKNFNRHFEGQMIPLLTALDPETGCGFNREPEETNPLLETLQISDNSAAEQQTWSPVHSMLLNKWHRRNQVTDEIELHDDDLLQLRGAHAEQPIIGMSVLFHLQQDKVVLETAGGANAVALAGRFTVADEGLARSLKEMAEALEKTNPDILFAEILHLTHPHTDNVNRRRAIYRYELPVTARSFQSEHEQIDLNDLYVFVHNGQVILWSIKHKKVVMPMLSTAYNFGIDRLHLFRFLALIPYQFGRTSLNFDLTELFPGLEYYPQVAYKNAVIFEATWIFMPAKLFAGYPKRRVAAKTAFRAWAAAQHLPEQFAMIQADRIMAFNSAVDQDLEIFFETVANTEQVKLRSFNISSRSGLLRDAGQQLHLTQFNAFILPAEPFEVPKQPPMITVRRRIKKRFMPGSEWLYLKIYTVKSGANKLLRLLLPLLKRYRQAGQVIEWFFIRYTDHAPHIRLRLRTSPEHLSHILQEIRKRLQGHLDQQVIREYQVDTYVREMERYHTSAYDLVESQFCQSSELVVAFLFRKKPSGTSLYLFGLHSLKSMIDQFITDNGQRLRFTLNLYESFLPEFGTRSLKPILDGRYRELREDIDGMLATHQFPGGERFQAAYRDFNQSNAALANAQSRETDQQWSLLASLIHMHVNRIFSSDQRKNEMVIYYMLFKYYRSVTGRTKKPS